MKSNTPSTDRQPIIIDGSRYSGSGTIVRDAVPFAILTGRPVRMMCIRSRREKPGLRAQHVKCLRAAAQINQGRLAGAEKRSQEILYILGSTIAGGFFSWDIETAGSATMMALSLIPLALIADKASEYWIRGGLFQDFAPTALHMRHVLLPILAFSGADISLDIIRPGYVPIGGGEIRLRIQPAETCLNAFDLTDPGKIRKVRGISLSSHLSARRVSERMADSSAERLRKDRFSPKIEIRNDEADHPAFQLPAFQPGAALTVWAETEKGCLLGSDLSGALGRPAERIGRQTANHLLSDLKTGAAVDRHTADQLIPLAALAKGESIINILEITDHIESRCWLAETILGARTRIEGTRLSISGIEYDRKT